MFPAPLLSLAGELLAQARAKGLKIVTAESCTGGLVSGVLTEIAGSSDVFERGFVTYSNAAKMAHLNVPRALIEQEGAVSEAVARAMAEGALAASSATLSVAVTGVAGPGGGTALKPVGLVHFAAARAGGRIIAQRQLFGPQGRSAIRLASVERALSLLRQLI